MFETHRIADDFSMASHHYAARAKLQEKIGTALIAKTSPHITSDAVLLDVGAGSGALTKRWPVVRKMALDYSIGMCEEARASGLTVINASAEQLPVHDAAVNVVTSNLMLQWVSQPQTFFAESFRVLKPGGILAITSFVEGTLVELAKAFSDAGEQARVSHFIAAEQLTKHLKHSGFEVILDNCEQLQEKYFGVMELCRFLVDIGASNKRADRPRGLLTLRKLRQVTAAYPRDGVHIHASWVVHTVIARKK